MQILEDNFDCENNCVDNEDVDDLSNFLLAFDDPFFSHTQQHHIQFPRPPSVFILSLILV